MDYETLTFEKKGSVGILTLNRPSSLNAINFAMRDELTSVLSALEHDVDTRVLVLTGAGRGFCAGLDVRDPEIMGARYTPEQALANQRRFSRFVAALRRCRQPVIGAINGAAAGAGFSLAMACDVRFASPHAKFSAAYINLGVGGADMGSSWLLPRLVGLGNAARWLYTGDLMDAAEAYRIGLVQELIEGDDLVARALALARTMASKSPLGLQVTKEALDRNSTSSLEDALAFEDRNQALCIAQLFSH